MTEQIFWKNKIKAFLFTPPDIALFPNDAKERAKRLIAVALGEDEIEDFSETEKADKMAAASDILPIEQLLGRSTSNVFLDNPLIIHPLSGESYSLKEEMPKVESGDASQVEEIIKKAIEEIRESCKDKNNQIDYKKFFFALWRKLPDQLQREEQKIPNGLKLGAFWDILPADPCMPTHSVWDHSAVASMFAGSMPEPAILMFTIGSPQEFISVARRTQDFWMSSFLFSYLTWQAIKVVIEECGPDSFVFPSLHQQPLVDLWFYEEEINVYPDIKDTKKFAEKFEQALQVANFPNVFTAIVPKEKAAQLAEQAKTKLLETWEGVANEVKEEFKKAVKFISNGSTELLDTIWNRQINDLFDRLGIFWVVCPWKKDKDKSGKEYVEQVRAYYDKNIQEENPLKISLGNIIDIIKDYSINDGITYPLLSKMAASAMTTRKNVRNFNQVEEPGWKCSLCGVRQALIDKDYSDQGIRDFWKDLSKVAREQGFKLQGRIRNGERLCAVCLTKRLALEAYFETKDILKFDRHIFPSTITVATSPFKLDIIEKLKGQDSSNLFEVTKEYVRSVKCFLCKYKMFYGSSALPKLKKEVEKLDPSKFEILKEFLKIDGGWLFEESFDSEVLKKEFDSENNKLGTEDKDFREAREKAVKGLKELLETTKRLNITSPSRYYAIIAMDGDKMSHWVSGVSSPFIEQMLHPDLIDCYDVEKKLQNTFAPNNEPIRRLLGPAMHMSLSTLLKNFALIGVPKAVEEEHLGKLVYAGADDVLTLVPVRELLPVLGKLNTYLQGSNPNSSGIRRGFIESIDVTGLNHFHLMAGAPYKSKRDGEIVKGVTASAGVVIIHENYPLSKAITEALYNVMKHVAKDSLGRDAFAIRMAKRAGGPVDFGMKWNEPFSEQNILEELKTIVSYVTDKKLSSKLPYDMASRQLGLKGDITKLKDKSLQDESCEDLWWYYAQKQEIARLTKQHLFQISKEEKAKIANHIQQFLEIITLQIQERMKIQHPPENLDEPWTRLINLLLVARFISTGN